MSPDAGYHFGGSWRREGLAFRNSRFVLKRWRSLLAHRFRESNSGSMPEALRSLRLTWAFFEQLRETLGRSGRGVAVCAPGPASGILDGPDKWRFSPLVGPRRAAATLERAERAMAAVGGKTPFLLVYYGTDGGGGWQWLDVPLRTITTLDRFALVQPSSRGHMMRMLQPVELQRAMGFPSSFCFPDGPRREKIRILGNAVCPPVMQQIVSALSEGQRFRQRTASAVQARQFPTGRIAAIRCTS